MTKEQLYTLACVRYAEPAVLMLGNECILGYWVLRTAAKGIPLMLTSKRFGMVLVERASSWDALARKADLAPLPVAAALPMNPPPTGSSRPMLDIPLPAPSSRRKLNGAGKR